MTLQKTKNQNIISYCVTKFVTQGCYITFRPKEKQCPFQIDIDNTKVSLDEGSVLTLINGNSSSISITSNSKFVEFTASQINEIYFALTHCNTDNEILKLLNELVQNKTVSIFTSDDNLSKLIFNHCCVAPDFSLDEPQDSTIIGESN